MMAAACGWMPAPSRQRFTETCVVPRVMPRCAAASCIRFARPLFETFASSMTAINCAFGSRLMRPCQPENDGECSSCHSILAAGGSLVNPLVFAGVHVNPLVNAPGDVPCVVYWHSGKQAVP
ncbi:hypothetical protein SVIOM74S_04713 [Streptomyces violarus]